MFKSLGGIIGKKAAGLNKKVQTSEKINLAFARFLEESFPEGKGMVFDLSSSNQNVIVQTPNKTVANELILKMADLARSFKEEGISPGQIVIR